MLKFIAFFVPCFTFAQPTIKDMIAKDSLLYAVTTDGKIKCWNLSTEKKKTVTHNSRFTFTAISSDKQQNVVVGTNDGKLFTLSDKGLQLLHAMQKPYTIEHIVFNSQNEPYLIICNALYAPLTHTYWTAFPQQTTVGIRIEKRAKEFFRFPSCVFVDAHDVIWMTNFYGEFGGSFQLFDSKERKPLNRSIENLELGLFFPQSIFSVYCFRLTTSHQLGRYF